MDILERKNIILNSPLTNKDDIIRYIGHIFYKDGYTTAAYTQAMLDKEKTFNTAIGNSVAIPHGTEDGKKEVRSSGLVIMTFPNGIDWNGTTVTLVIGIAGAGDEHVEMLSNIAIACSDEDDVTDIVHSTADEIYAKFAAID